MLRLCSARAAQQRVLHWQLGAMPVLVAACSWAVATQNYLRASGGQAFSGIIRGLRIPGGTDSSRRRGPLSPPIDDGRAAVAEAVERLARIDHSRSSRSSHPGKFAMMSCCAFGGRTASRLSRRTACGRDLPDTRLVGRSACRRISDVRPSAASISAEAALPLGLAPWPSHAEVQLLRHRSTELLADIARHIQG